MKIIIEIECDNAAFEDHAGAEVARILRRYAEKVVHYAEKPPSMRLFDRNDNYVGDVEVTDAPSNAPPEGV